MTVSLAWSLALAGLLAQAAPVVPAPAAPPASPAPAPAPAPPPPPATTTFPLRVSIATGADGKSVATGDWLASQLASAEAVFAPFGVAFAKTAGTSLGAGVARVETRADRDAFAGQAMPHSIDVFVVESLRDVDEPDTMRRGVHWHAPSGTHYVILVGTAPPGVLAHELGHYFGNPHSKVVDNVMSYERSEPGAHVFFDADQGARIAAKAKAYVRSRELWPLPR